MTRIVAIGECMVELAPAPTAGDFHLGFAGDTMNTAWYLRQLLPADHTIDFMSAVGVDRVSDDMMAFLAQAGLGNSHILRRADRTVGLYMIRLTDGERSFSYWRGQSAARTLARDADDLRAALTGADIAYVSGITLAILSDADRARLFAALRDLRQRGGQIVFDPNLRPSLWDTPDGMCDAVMQAAGLSDTVLPSYEDEATWFGDADPAATARRYAAAGAGCVVVKNGADPMLTLVDGQTLSHAPVQVAAVVDTTAAGDSFNAGYLAARMTGADQAGAVAKGASLAARVIGARGALINVS